MASDTTEDTDRFLARLEPGCETSKQRYERVRHRLIKFFQWRACEDPANLADETVQRFFEKIRAGQEVTSDTPYGYVYAVASNVFREYLREIRKHKVIADMWLRRIPTPPDSTIDCGKRCLEDLDPDKRSLLERYYLDSGDSEKLASELGLSLNALRLKVHRTKSQLRACYEDCLRRKGN
jgi:DNA-directed RNA polymerase specialized sigma24 family protein